MKLKYGGVFLLGILFFSCASLSEENMDDVSMERIASYRTKGTTLIPLASEEGATAYPLSQGVQAYHQALWDRALEIIPDDYEGYIRRFEISSDGLEGVMAYVEAHERDGNIDFSSWSLGMDSVDAMDHMGVFKSEELDKSLIHEFAHILSLNSSQMDPVAAEELGDESWMEDWDFDDRYRSYDGISRKGSYLDSFFQEFWGAEQMRDWFDMEMNSGSDEEYWKALTTLSIRHHTDFVSDYAMTNPEEDFAESFLYFVLEEKPEGDLVSHRKVRFFYTYPELVRMRRDIRGVLSADLAF